MACILQIFREVNKRLTHHLHHPCLSYRRKCVQIATIDVALCHMCQIFFQILDMIFFAVVTSWNCFRERFIIHQQHKTRYTCIHLLVLCHSTFMHSQNTFFLTVNLHHICVTNALWKAPRAYFMHMIRPNMYFGLSNTKYMYNSVHYTSSVI